ASSWRRRMSTKGLMGGICMLGVGGLFVAIGFLWGESSFLSTRTGVRTRGKAAGHKSIGGEDYPLVEFKNNANVTRRVLLSQTGGPPEGASVDIVYDRETGPRVQLPCVEDNRPARAVTMC